MNKREFSADDPRVVCFADGEHNCILIDRNSNMLQNMFTFFCSELEPGQDCQQPFFISAGTFAGRDYFKVKFPGIEQKKLEALCIYLDLNLLYYAS